MGHREESDHHYTIYMTCIIITIPTVRLSIKFLHVPNLPTQDAG